MRFSNRLFKMMLPYFLFFLFMQVLPGIKANSSDVAKIIAKVNGDVITTKDLQDYCVSLALKLSNDEKSLSCEDKGFKTEALDKLIDDRLILEEARKGEFEVPHQVISEKLERMIVSYPSKDEFDKSLADKGLTITSLKEIIKEKYLMQLIIERNVRARVSVSPQEVSELYNAKRKEFIAPKMYVFYIAQSVEYLQIKELSLAIDDYGIEKVSDSSKLIVMIESSMSELRPELGDLLKHLSPGEKEIGQIDDMHFLIYLIKTKEPRLLSLSEVKENVYAYAKDIKFKIRFDEWIKELRSRAVIKKMQ